MDIAGKKRQGKTRVESASSHDESVLRGAGGAGFEDLDIGDKEDVSGNEMIEEPAIWCEAHIQAFLNDAIT